MMWIILPLIAILTVLIISSVVLAYFNFRPRIENFEKCCEKEKNLYRISDKNVNNSIRSEVNIKSPSGNEFTAFFIPASNNDKAIILIHNSPYTIYGNSKYIDMFTKRGYNILIYNYSLQWHGKKSFCTYGSREKLDIKACCDWIFNKCGKECRIGVHGEYIGAVMAILGASCDRRIRFCIADSPFSDLETHIKYTLKSRYNLISFPVLNISNLFYKLFSGVFYKNVSPINEVRGLIAPTLFIHGMNDTEVPYTDSAGLNERKGGLKELYLVPSAGHLKSYSVNPEKYERVLDLFLSKAGV